jgi:hypothetical protein
MNTVKKFPAEMNKLVGLEVLRASSRFTSSYANEKGNKLECIPRIENMSSIRLIDLECMLTVDWVYRLH